MPLPLLAVPVIHSAGGWIASAGGSYLGGTLSTSWAGAFILGNSSFLSGLGLGAIGTGAAAFASGAGAAASAGAAAVGSAATSAGVALGIVTPTFLGLTPIGWAVTGATLSIGAAAYAVWRYKNRDIISLIDAQLDEINAERQAGGLDAFKSTSALIRSLFRSDEK
jgi:hypothetical protein